MNLIIVISNNFRPEWGFERWAPRCLIAQLGEHRTRQASQIPDSVLSSAKVSVYAINQNTWNILINMEFQARLKLKSQHIVHLK